MRRLSILPRPIIAVSVLLFWAAVSQASSEIPDQASHAIAHAGRRAGPFNDVPAKPSSDILQVLASGLSDLREIVSSQLQIPQPEPEGFIEDSHIELAESLWSEDDHQLWLDSSAEVPGIEAPQKVSGTFGLRAPLASFAHHLHRHVSNIHRATKRAWSHVTGTIHAEVDSPAGTQQFTFDEGAGDFSEAHPIFHSAEDIWHSFSEDLTS